MNISKNNPLKVAFYNEENYDNAQEALIDGAVYDMPYSVSLYGHSGVLDIWEIAKTLSECSGAGMYIPAIIDDDGIYRETDDVLHYFEQIEEA